MATRDQAQAGPKAARRPPGRNGFRYREQFGLVVVCRDEPHQALLYGELTKAGHKVKVVCV